MDAESPVCKWPELLPYNSYTGEKVFPFNAISKARFIVKHKNPAVPDIFGEPGDFKTIKDLVDLCTERQYKYLGLKLSDLPKKDPYRLKDYFKYRIEEVYKENEQHQFRLNWLLIKLPLI